MIAPKRDNVLLAVICSVETGNLKPTFHVLKRMQERKILLSDIHEAIFSARREEHKDEYDDVSGDWKYAIRGMNDDGNKDIRLIVVFKDPTTIVLTVINLNQMRLV